MMKIKRYPDHQHIFATTKPTSPPPPINHFDGNDEDSAEDTQKKLIVAWPG